jgi:hypothetical protein
MEEVGMNEIKESNPKDAIANDRIPLWLLSPFAKAHWAIAQFAGLAKYGAWNWRKSGVRASIYISAAERHLDAWKSGEEFDPIDGSHHLGNVMACVAILIEAQECSKLVDDRPPSLSLRPAYERLAGVLARLRGQYKDRAPQHFTIAETEECFPRSQVLSLEKKRTRPEKKTLRRKGKAL